MILNSLPRFSITVDESTVTSRPSCDTSCSSDKTTISNCSKSCTNTGNSSTVTAGRTLRNSPRIREKRQRKMTGRFWPSFFFLLLRKVGFLLLLGGVFSLLLLISFPILQKTFILKTCWNSMFKALVAASAKLVKMVFVLLKAWICSFLIEKDHFKSMIFTWKRRKN